MISPEHLFEGALKLAEAPAAGKPRQADLRRALSTAYYGLFHAALREGADQLVGSSQAKRATKAWALVYRAFNHREMAKRCGQLTSPPSPLEAADFGAQARSFATEFKTMQNDRHRADYDPRARFRLSSVRSRILAAKAALGALQAVPEDERRLFLTFLLIGSRTDN